VSSRRRSRGVVIVVAIVAAAIAAVVAWAGRADEGSAQEAAGPREGAPPLALDAFVSNQAEAEGLAGAARLYQDGKRRDALEAFQRVLAANPDSLYAQIGVAFALWPDGTLEQLRKLEARDPASGLVQLHLGLALYWQGRLQEAEEAWRKAEEIEPDSSAALRAESLLHPEMPAGRPFFVPAEPLPQDLEGRLPLEQLDALERRAQGSTRATPWIQYGVALQRAGRSLSARDAFDKAVELEPDNPEALVAAAVARFDKDEPSQTFSRLGPLTTRFPDEPVVRFHLGLCLIWLRRLDEARNQLEQTRADGGQTVWGRQASELLDTLDSAATAG
jgi:tetratricopeptide (TPR) repeat protein